MATAGSETLNSATYTTLFDPSASGSVTTVAVWILDSVSEEVHVHVSNLHASGDVGMRLLPGKVEYFTIYPRGLGLVKAICSTSTPVVYYSVVSKKLD
jgi:hypothetical protein